MVGHLLEYHPGVETLKEIVDSGELGDVHYVYSHRLNLGKLRADENALWSLGAHDISVLLHLLGEEPVEVDGARRVLHARRHRGRRLLLPALPVRPRGAPAPLLAGPAQGAPLHGRRRRAGWRPSTTWTLERKVTVYDKGFDEDAASYGEYITRSGDVRSPQIPNREPLRIECEHFVDCIRTGATPRSDGHSGLRVVRVLEALQNSLEASRRERACARLNARRACISAMASSSRTRW